MYDAGEEAYFSLGLFTNRLKMGFPRWTLVKKAVQTVKIHWLSG